MRTRHMVYVGLLVAVGLPAVAAARPYPLAGLPAPKLQALAPILRTSDLALIESHDSGKLRQVTTITYVAAPPQAVRQVVIEPERYGEFVRNMKVSQVTRAPDGTPIHKYGISYVIHTVEGVHHYLFPPPEASSPAAPVEMYDPDPEGQRHYRWEFLPAAGGGTVLVLYGYPFIPRDPFLDKFIGAAKTLEHGIGLTTQMIQMLSMKQRAEQLTPSKPAAPAGPAGGFEFMLPRGTVAVFRTAGGRLADIALVDRTSARVEILTELFADPTKWPQFLPTIRRATPLGVIKGTPGVEIEQSLPLVSWTSAFACRFSAGSADQFAVSGDLRGGQWRWDVRPREGGQSELTLRAVSPYGQSSLLIRQLYKLEPLFEYGITVGLNLVLQHGLRYQGERLTQARATR